MSYVPLVKLELQSPESPFLGASQRHPDGRCEAAASLSAGRRGQLWGQTAAETSLRPGSPLRSSVSCPSSQLLTLLPTCGLRPTPRGPDCKPLRLQLSQDKGPSPPDFQTVLSHWGPPTPPLASQMDCVVTSLIPPPFSLKCRSLLMRTHPLSQSFMCWRSEHSQSPAQLTPAPF